MGENKNVFRAGDHPGAGRKRTAGKNVFRVDAPAEPAQDQTYAWRTSSRDALNRVDTILSDDAPKPPRWPEPAAPAEPAPPQTAARDPLRDDPPADADPFNSFYGHDGRARDAIAFSPETPSEGGALSSDGIPDIDIDISARIAQTRGQFHGPSITGPGHITQTTEIPIVGSAFARQADTAEGIFVELEDGGHPAKQPGADEQPEDIVELPLEAKDDGWKDITAFAIQENGLRADEPMQAGKTWIDAEPVLAKEKRGRRAGGRKRRGVLITAIIVLAVLLITPAALYLASFRLVRVYDGGALEKILLSRETDGDRLIEDAGVAVEDYDGFDLEENGVFRDVHIARATVVTITADGVTSTHHVLADTVQQAVVAAGYTLSDDDVVEPGGGDALDADSHIVIYRVSYVERFSEETIPWQEVEKRSPLVPDGQRVTMNEGGGADGAGIVSYLDKYVDGIYTESEATGVSYTDYPVNVVTLVGDSTAPMSPIDGADYTDIAIVGNAPESYERVIEGGVCTAYSFNPGAYGASGMFLVQGFVAVDPDIIPYGSLLYITSADGSFVYGWAIAADTGTAMADGRVDADCFFETYRESTLFGRHTMDIYVVKQLTQQELAAYAAVSGTFHARVPAA